MKNIVTMLFFVSLLFSAGCTWQTPAPTPTAPTGETQEIPKSTSTPTSVTPTPSAEISATMEPQPLATEEFQPAITPTTVEDIYNQVHPDDQRVFFWYFLPPQSPADLALNRIVDGFNQSNPYEIFVDAYNQSTVTGVLTRTLPLLNTADMPALVMTNADMVYQLADGLETLGPLISSPTWGFASDEYAKFNPAMIAQGQFPEFSPDLYAFPALRTAEILYQNMDWSGELGYYQAPKTTQELSDLACAAAGSPMRGIHFAKPVGLEVSPGIGAFAALTGAFGGTIQPLEATIFQLNTPGSIEGMKYLAEFGSRNCFRFPTGDVSEVQNFVDSSAAMLLSNSTDLISADEHIKSGLNFSWESTGLPTPEQSQQIVILPGLNFSLTRQSSEQIVAAWLFIKYFQTQAAQEIWISATGNIPLSPAIVTGSEMPNVYNSMLYLVETAEFIPAYPQAEQVNDLIQGAMQSCLQGSPVEQVLNALQSSVEELTANFYSSP